MAVPLLVLKVTVVATELGLLKVTVNTLLVPSGTVVPLLTDTVTGSLAAMVLVTVCVPAAPNTAPVGADRVTAKVSAGSPVVSSMVGLRTITLVTPAGIVMMPVPGTAVKVVPPSVE